jgi:hypothetical protein
MKWVLIIVGALVALVVIALVIGFLVPRQHVAGSSVTLRQPRDTVWRLVRDLAGTAGWWAEVATSQRASDAAGREVWEQQLKNGFTMRLMITEDAAPARLVTTIDAPPDAPFGGTWTYELATADEGTRLTVTERGYVNNPLFRFMSRFIFGYYATIESYLKALGKKLGEDVQPIRQS